MSLEVCEKGEKTQLQNHAGRQMRMDIADLGSPILLLPRLKLVPLCQIVERIRMRAHGPTQPFEALFEAGGVAVVRQTERQ